MPTAPLSPPRPELLALLDAVKDNPDDDTPRLVLADWLDEQDNALDAERAKFIRRDIAASRAPEPPRVPDQVRRDEADLFRRWLGPLTEFASGWSFVRGLPRLAIPGPDFLKAGFRPLLATETFAFVQFVVLADAAAWRLEEIVAMPEFRHVPGLSADPFDALGTRSAARLFGSPNLTGLRQIEFCGVDPGAVGMRALARNPALARLRTLALYHNKLVDKAVEVLAAAPHLSNLTRLDLRDNLIGDKGARALAASPVCANLLELDLRDNPRLTDRGKQLLRDKFGDRVKC